MPRSSRYGEYSMSLERTGIATTCRHGADMAAHLRRRPREGVGVSIDWRQVGRAVGTEDALVVCHARQRRSQRGDCLQHFSTLQPKVLCVLDHVYTTLRYNLTTPNLPCGQTVGPVLF